MSVAKAEAAIDGWVDRFDPAALRRAEVGSRDRHLDVVANGDGRGLAYVEGTLYAQDAAALEQRVAQLAGGGVRTIRAPLISVAPMRWVRWRPVPIGWGVAAVTRSAPRPTRQRRVRRWCMSLPRSAAWPMTRRCSSMAWKLRGRGCLSRCGR